MLKYAYGGGGVVLMPAGIFSDVPKSIMVDLENL